MNINEGIEFWKLLNNIKSCSGYSVYRELMNKRYSYLYYFYNKTVLLKNLNDLNKWFSKPQRKIDVLRWRKQRVLSANISNFILASQNFIEHTRGSKNVQKEKLYRFFREVRNMLSHHHDFELTTKINYLKASEPFIFHTMPKERFISYLDNKVNILNKKGDKAKYTEQIENLLLVIEFIKSLPANYNLEILFKEYFLLIDNYYSLIMKTFIQAEFQSLKEFYVKVELLHKTSISLITKTQLRYIRYLLYKFKPIAKA